MIGGPEFEKMLGGNVAVVGRVGILVAAVVVSVTGNQLPARFQFSTDLRVNTLADSLSLADEAAKITLIPIVLYRPIGHGNVFLNGAI